ncbi:MAG: redoxin domain-containing protein [Alphaproteobacteria bacterium]|nr:redoxin domain-containing protein [Alphaproteobacteria bacterium]
MELSESPIHAPEINRDGLIWLNTDKPLSLADLRGKLVLLDFWTFCCINCMHVLPTLQKVEKAFSHEVMVIGVHSPKFAAEKDIENVKQAIQRYDIRHPIIHDPNHILWGQYNVHAWPTMVFIDPNGYIAGVTTGEPEPLHLMNSVRDALDEYEEKGVLTSSAFTWATPKIEKTTLRFPAKIKPLPGQIKQWMVADSGHNQIVLFDDHGVELERYGSGRADCDDGDKTHACFNSPQGLIANNDSIYVADTGNHAVRRIDRNTGMVTTLSGTGLRGMMLINKFEKAFGRSLASPWDLEIKNHILFFSNAGTHQIGAIDLVQGVVRVIAGSGAEGLRDGDLLFSDMAQPSGLVLNSDKSKLFFTDSETSSIRFVDMDDIKVRTIVGKGLFDFGHVNGSVHDALLQHPLGVTLFDDDRIVVADSYNNALRMIDMNTLSVNDVDNQEWVCTDDVCLPFHEPAGIWADGENRLLVCDTNNHRIVEIRRDLKTSRKWA